MQIQNSQELIQNCILSTSDCLIQELPRGPGMRGENAEFIKENLWGVTTLGIANQEWTCTDSWRRDDDVTSQIHHSTVRTVMHTKKNTRKALRQRASREHSVQIRIKSSNLIKLSKYGPDSASVVVFR